jgi:hypothetical protein
VAGIVSQDGSTNALRQRPCPHEPSPVGEAPPWMRRAAAPPMLAAIAAEDMTP